MRNATTDCYGRIFGWRKHFDYYTPVENIVGNQLAFVAMGKHRLVLTRSCKVLSHVCDLIIIYYLLYFRYELRFEFRNVTV